MPSYSGARNAERQRGTYQDEVDVGKGTDEGEQDTEAKAESRAQFWVAPMLDHRRQRRSRRGDRMHGRDAFDRKVNQQRACEIEQGKEIEIRYKAKIVSDGCRNQTP